MAIKIIRATDAVKVSVLKVLLYGQPGLGKTSLAFTCNAPLCLDFDKGAYRSKQRKDALDISAWTDIVELMKSPETLAPYKTIIVDTVGRCLDEITRHLLVESPKLGNRNGALSMQGWGELKGIFQAWMRQLTLLGKDVILIAHDKEDKDGDRVYKRPDISGGSYAEVLKTADLIGYMSMRNNKATLDFTPCDDYIAKNAAGFKLSALPDFANDRTCGARMLSQAKENMSSVAAQVAEAEDVIETWRTAIEGYSTPEELTGAVAAIAELPANIAGQVSALIKARRTALGLEYDKETKTFFKPLPPPETPAPTHPAPAKNGTPNFAF